MNLQVSSPSLTRTRASKSRLWDWLAEKFIFLVSLVVILLMCLIFLFVAGEALPVFLGDTGSSRAQPVIPAAQMDQLPPDQLRQYLGLTRQEFASRDRQTLKLLMEAREEGAQESSAQPDAKLNATSWRYSVLPYQWQGYSKPEFIWQPVSPVPKFNIVPLIIGTLKTALVAMLVSVPLALGAAIYVSQLARANLREFLKPAIEMLSGIPSVVLGFFALLVMASFFQSVFGYASRLNAFVAGAALGLAIIPVIFSIAEDALTSVPRAYVHAALALGSTRWQTAWNIVLPAALPGVFAAIILGLGRAIGETMIVLMASGNASILSWNILDSTRTISATIAAELAETVAGGEHYRMLFVIGVLLFAVTFVANLIGDLVRQQVKRSLEGGVK